MSQAVIAALLVMTALPAAALDPQDGRHRGGRARDVGPDSAASTVRDAYGGRVLGVRPGPGNGERDYRVRVLTPDGTVRTIEVDRATGRIRD